MRRRTPAQNAAAAARPDVLRSPRARPAPASAGVSDSPAAAAAATRTTDTHAAVSGVAASGVAASGVAERPTLSTTLTPPSPATYAPAERATPPGLPSSYTAPPERGSGVPGGGVTGHVLPTNGVPGNAPAPAAPPAPRPADQPISANGVPGTQVEGHLLRFSVPQEGTLQFLPGRLEIASGLDSGREIRFVRVPGPNGTEVTFGRSEGPAYRHVQLREGTVSRAHARLRLLEGQWHLCNLSATNPVVHNGKILRDGEEQQLADGDRIEMGEVVFGFRSR